MARHVVAPVDELPPGTRKFLRIDERPIAIFNIKGEFFGLLNRCPHQGAALCEGPLIGLAQSSDPGEIEYTKLGEIIRCPWHGWEFDIRTGQSYCDPKRFRARAYPVNVEPGASVVKGPYVAETIKVSVESDYVVDAVPEIERIRLDLFSAAEQRLEAPLLPAAASAALPARTPANA
jgi:nitrite reductase/ring-hydroxylating ferredoxin subunit